MRLAEAGRSTNEICELKVENAVSDANKQIFRTAHKILVRGMCWEHGETANTRSPSSARVEYSMKAVAWHA